MNKNIKTFLLTLIALSLVTIAGIEISGISNTAFFNPKSDDTHSHHPDDRAGNDELKARNQRDSLRKVMPTTTIQYDQENHDFGTIKEGTKAVHTFEFTNTGATPLLISDVISPCGCTTPNYSKQPVMPGKKGSITIEFDSKNRPGLANKKLTVIANTQPDRTYVSFTTKVE